jgi:hypothetical protein
MQEHAIARRFLAALSARRGIVILPNDRLHKVKNTLSESIYYLIFNDLQPGLHADPSPPMLCA